MDFVLVTGASGFLASNIVKTLLEEGYKVRGTVRNLKDEKKVTPLKNLAKNTKYDLELCEADLLKEESWLNAVKDCNYVIHTASPVPNYVPSDENEIIKPAVNGTLFVLKACVQEGSQVKRVVLTSSVAAIAGDDFQTGKVYSETDFSIASVSQPYTKSKILAEKTAWDFVEERKKNNQSCFELSVINPGYICGPILTETFCSSIEPIKRLMLKEMPMIPDIVLPICDVRDVSKVHINALKDPSAISKRFQIVTSSLSFQEFAKILETEFKAKGYSIPTRVAPNFLLKFASFFVKELEFVIPYLGKKPLFDNSQFKSLLKSEPIEQKKSIIDMAYSLIEKGFIPKKF